VTVVSSCTYSNLSLLLTLILFTIFFAVYFQLFLCILSYNACLFVCFFPFVLHGCFLSSFRKRILTWTWTVLRFFQSESKRHKLAVQVNWRSNVTDSRLACHSTDENVKIARRESRVWCRPVGQHFLVKLYRKLNTNAIGLHGVVL